MCLFELGAKPACFFQGIPFLLERMMGRQIIQTRHLADIFSKIKKKECHLKENKWQSSDKISDKNLSFHVKIRILETLYLPLRT